MTAAAMLEACREKARADQELAARFLAVRNEKAPLSAFCAICRELGYDLSPMDVVDAGESAYAAMRRSTNGGGENAPLLEGEDDYFEMFLTSLA